MHGEPGVGMEEFEVRIEPHGVAFRAPASMPLLQAAAAQGIEMPASCRNGTCRACMLFMRSGRIEYTIAWPGLLAEEKAEGWILPCVAQPRADLLLEGVGA